MIEERTRTVIDPVTHLPKQIPLTPLPELIAAADAVGRQPRWARMARTTTGS
jgi:hypothetical protein